MPETLYESIIDDIGTVIKRTDGDGSVWWIPTNPENSDYQAYLRWLENPDATYDAQQAMSNAHVATE